MIEAQLKFITSPGRAWYVKKVFNDRRHVDFFIDYIQKKKGYIFDEIWYP